MPMVVLVCGTRHLPSARVVTGPMGQDVVWPVECPCLGGLWLQNSVLGKVWLKPLMVRLRRARWIDLARADCHDHLRLDKVICCGLSRWSPWAWMLPVRAQLSVEQVPVLMLKSVPLGAEIYCPVGGPWQG